MKSSLAVILIGLCVAGCKSSVPLSDPFAGRTTIAPPPTGSITGRMGDPGLLATPPAVQLPSQPTASAATPTAQPGFAAPGGWSAQPSATPGVGPSPAPITQPTSPLSSPGVPSGQPATSPPWPASSRGLAPRPQSTLPSSRSPSPSPAPGAVNPYAPGASSLNYPSPSARSAVPLVPTRTDTWASSAANIGPASYGTSASAANRAPRPVDDGSSSGNSTSRPSIVRTIQPRGAVESSSDRPVEISDLPTSPPGGP